MAHARMNGTAWEKTKEDYVYARAFDRTGWAWEFLRRNQGYCRDFRTNRAGLPVLIRHNSGAAIYRPRRRFLAAESWGLTAFADPNKTAFEADLFWLPEITTHAARCHSRPSTDNEIEAVSLMLFRGRRAVFAGLEHEITAIRAEQLSAHMISASGTLLAGNCCVRFFHEGLKTASRHHETLRILNHLTNETVARSAANTPIGGKYLTYLIALDGHLEGRTYRDIAEILYGHDRVGQHWTDDTRWMKSQVRRAVARGIALMNGGYRDLL